MPATEAFCPECGAAIERGGTDGSDSAVYPELARANLLRMRGDYKQAEDQCLAVLRRYPNNTTANILLGDICAEKGDLEQAMQWYEMALDLAPDSAPARAKLDRVRQRFREKETTATVEQLGLPTTKSRAGIYALALIGSIFVIAVVAYFLGQRVEQRRIGKVVDLPVEATGTGETGGTSSTPLSSMRQTPSRDDEALSEMLRQKATDGEVITSAIQDPRTGGITLTFAAVDSEDPRSLAARLAREVFKEVPDAPTVTLRGTRRGQLIFIADALRSHNEETLTPTWQTEHAKEPDAWIDRILTSVWPKREEAPAPQPGAPQDPPQQEPADPTPQTPTPVEEPQQDPPEEPVEGGEPEVPPTEGGGAQELSQPPGDNP